MDNIFSEIIYNIYGKRYKIKYFDNQSEEKVNEYKQKSKMLEAEAIKKANIEAEKQRREEMAEKRKEVEAREQELLARRNQNNGQNGTTSSGNSNSEINKTIPNNSTSSGNTSPKPDSVLVDDEEQSPVIYGRNANIKDPLLKIVDLTC